MLKQMQSLQHGNANPAPDQGRQAALGDASRRTFMGVPRKVMQGITAFVITAIVNTALLPLANAQQAKTAQEAQAKAMEQAAAPTAADKYQNSLQALKDSVLGKDGFSSQAKASALSGADPNNTIPFEVAAEGMRAEWADLNQKWKSAGVSQEILSRQAEIEAAFEKKHAELISVMKQSDGSAKRAALSNFLTENVPNPTHHKINLDNMPWQVLKATKQEPLQDADALNAKLLAAAVPAQPKNQSNSQSKTAPAKAAENFLKAGAAPTAEDLAETIDAPQTADIKALANSLDKNPHKIYQWVHDNVYYFPSHGSVQGAQDTLDKKSGNAFDQASLLIATLRASGIPARYVYGSVEIPAEQVMNWVGGVKTIDAAQQILGQGGVPNVALVSGGQIKTIRIEHVWVEAYVRNNPDRGARNTGGQAQGDSWLAMDASFKQYIFKEGMNLSETAPINVNTLTNTANKGAESNKTEGWIRNPNAKDFDSEIENYQNTINTYIDSKKTSPENVSMIFGLKSSIVYQIPYIAGTLPYKLTARSKQFSEVPNELRSKFKYSIYSSMQDATWDNGAILNIELPTVKLSGKNINLAWTVASNADKDAISALIPKSGADLTASQIPKSISSSIYLKPQIIIDGEIYAEGSSLSAGSEPIGVGAFTSYDYTQWDQTTDQLIAGQQSAIGLSIQGISGKQLERIKNKISVTKNTIINAASAPAEKRGLLLGGVKGNDILGDLLSSSIAGYFTQVQSHGVALSSQEQIIDLPGLSYGLFHAKATPRKLYGIVTTGVSFGGLNIDVGHMRSLRWVKDDDLTSSINKIALPAGYGFSPPQYRWISYNKSRGQFSSSMEHEIIENLWVDKSNNCRFNDIKGNEINSGKNACPQAFSAVKAISTALNQGQKVFSIDKYNSSTAINTLPLSGDSGEEIRSAITSGKEVIFHEKRISSPGWSGLGYIIIDPSNGTGAYLIEGKGNGGDLSQSELEGIVNFQGLSLGIGLSAATLAMLLAAGTAFVSFTGPLIVPILAVLAAIAFAAMLTYLIIESDGNARGCIYQGINVTIKLFLARVIASIAMKRGFGDASFMEKFLSFIGLGHEALDPFIPDTPIQDCMP